MICRLLAAAFLLFFLIRVIYSLHKKALTRHKAASEPTMYFIERKTIDQT